MPHVPVAVAELRKQTSWSKTRARMYHYRTQTGSEVDVVLEGAGAGILGIEVKAGATISTGDFKGLKALADALGDRFHRGVLLYTGKEALPFGKQVHALPVSALWRIGR